MGSERNCLVINRKQNVNHEKYEKSLNNDRIKKIKEK